MPEAERSHLRSTIPAPVTFLLSRFDGRSYHRDVAPAWQPTRWESRDELRSEGSSDMPMEPAAEAVRRMPAGNGEYSRTASQHT
jgi:hypothetical protein